MKKKEEKREPHFLYVCARARARCGLYLRVVVSSSSRNGSRDRRGRESEREEEEKSYFIKNGIEPLLPSRHHRSSTCTSRENARRLGTTHADLRLTIDR